MNHKSHKKLIPAERAWRIGRVIQDLLFEAEIKCVICGSARRGVKSRVHDVDLVVETDNLEIVKSIILSNANVRGVKARALTEHPKKSLDLLINDVQVNIIRTTEEAWGAAILFLTGSKLFNKIMNGFAKKQGMKLSPYGLFFNDELLAGRSEEQIFMALGIPFIEPKYREDGQALKQYWDKESNGESSKEDQSDKKDKGQDQGRRS